MGSILRPNRLGRVQVFYLLLQRLAGEIAGDLLIHQVDGVPRARGSNGTYWNLIGFYGDLMGSHGTYWNLMDFYGDLMGSNGAYWNLMGFYGDLLGSNGIYWDIPSGKHTNNYGKIHTFIAE